MLSKSRMILFLLLFAINCMISFDFYQDLGNIFPWKLYPSSNVVHLENVGQLFLSVADMRAAINLRTCNSSTHLQGINLAQACQMQSKNCNHYYPQCTKYTFVWVNKTNCPEVLVQYWLWIRHVTSQWVPRDLGITTPQQLVLFQINARSRLFVNTLDYFYFALVGIRTK